MPKKIYWKALSDNLYSYAVEGVFTRVKYSFDKFVKAPEDARRYGYHLFVFDTKDHAKQFTGTDANIFPCKVKNIKTLVNKLRIRSLLLDYTMAPWKDAALDARQYVYVDWPKGTVMVEQVKLLKEVPKD